jgi:diacylglycerol kinase family enzyme
MNMLPHALYGQKPWRQALTAALSTGVERVVPGGEVDGQAFYVAAILGSPALWAEAREAVRDRKLKQAVMRARRALLQTFSGRLKFRLGDGPPRKAEALTLMSPLISRALDDETALEAAAMDVHTTGDVMRLGLRALLGEIGAGVGADVGSWRDDPAVSVELCRIGHAWASGRIPAILDGEPMRLPRSVEFVFKPAAFRALVPASPVAAA